MVYSGIANVRVRPSGIPSNAELPPTEIKTIQSKKRKSLSTQDDETNYSSKKRRPSNDGLRVELGFHKNDESNIQSPKDFSVCDGTEARPLAFRTHGSHLPVYHNEDNSQPPPEEDVVGQVLSKGLGKELNKTSSTAVSDDSSTSIGPSSETYRHEKLGSKDSATLIAQSYLVQPIQVSTNQGAQPLPVSSVDEESSSDEAPEVMTSIASLSQAREAAAGMKKARKRQIDSEKEKRRNKDARLKEKAVKLDRKKLPITSANNDARLSREDLAQRLLDADRLPDKLPEELLVDEPASRISSSAVHKDNKLNSRAKKKRLRAPLKSTKDIRYGNTVVRMLQPISRTLPPKNTKASKSLREAWLSGHRGKGSNGEQRKNSNKRFLRG